MAYHCNVPPPMVDDLTIVDFVILTRGIERLRAEIKERNSG